MSAKDIANANNKTKAGKQRRDDSETFDSRSQYTPYYNYPQQPTWVPPHNDNKSSYR
ncbi:r3h domain protein [Niveomyces insectorum RCEF 264]|uniref:R3h domain protein n=1 Tax=Niveomyces insectorum RCEF 264 TaxID=1081102 RepID=A0A167LLT6_9HYPO|nr:r3h domain protein [Niveomyces insectorum RCEF 264]